MQYLQVDLGFSTADAENIRLYYGSKCLLLEFLDWQELEVAIRFEEVLAFRWEDPKELLTIRDDTTYEVHGSEWLIELSHNADVDAEYAHYKLCFNELGALDVLSRRLRTE